MSTSKTPTKEEISSLINQINLIKKDLLYVSVITGMGMEEIMHIEDLRFYLYFGLESYHNMPLQIADRDKKPYAMFKAKAYDRNHNRIPSQDFMRTRFSETYDFLDNDHVLKENYPDVRIKIIDYLLTLDEDLTTGRIIIK